MPSIYILYVFLSFQSPVVLYSRKPSYLTSHPYACGQTIYFNRVYIYIYVLYIYRSLYIYISYNHTIVARSLDVLSRSLSMCFLSYLCTYFLIMMWATFILLYYLDLILLYMTVYDIPLLSRQSIILQHSLFFFFFLMFYPDSVESTFLCVLFLRLDCDSRTAMIVFCFVCLFFLFFFY